MTSPQHLVTPLPVGTAVLPGTLRARLEELRARGTQLNLKQAVGIVVPLCVEIANLHKAGHKLFIHPSSLVEDDLGFYKVSLDQAQKPPILPRDKACLAPEERGGQPGTARASVFAIGAILYELVSGQSVGPGMRRPSEVVSSLPQGLEVVLAKSLVSDPAHRPDDLAALAQALHQFAPPGSVPPPPPADVTHLDHGEGFHVDVSMSLMPPAPSKPRPVVEAAPMSSPYDMPVRSQPQAAAPSRPNATSELASLKARLESDPRPRYVVIKDGMDHGPFSAVECLQQIANHTFNEADWIRDTLTKDERPIKDWDEFAPFAENARLHRDIKAEKQAIDRVVAQESKSTTTKAVLVAGVVGVLLAGAAVWFLTVRGSKSDEVAVNIEQGSDIDIDGGLSGTKKGGGKGGRVLGRGAGGIPILSGGMSCEAAQAAYVEEMSMSGGGQKDLTAGQYGSVMNSGGYFAHCGVPDSTGVRICAAVQNGRAVGVTVTTSPRNGKLESCIAGGVRGLKFPSHPKLDVSRTTF
ncbi:MAG TPA: hypothetical protein VM686_11080 [Polyangiaceae bacterium]|nr:hypothetical protein [Polyangiaceae bacterium]